MGNDRSGSLGKASHFWQKNRKPNRTLHNGMPIAGDCLMLLNSKVRYVKSSKKQKRWKIY